jgi:hypothetical protein
MVEKEIKPAARRSPITPAPPALLQTSADSIHQSRGKQQTIARPGPGPFPLGISMGYAVYGHRESDKTAASRHQLQQPSSTTKTWKNI